MNCSLISLGWSQFQTVHKLDLSPGCKLCSGPLCLFLFGAQPGGTVATGDNWVSLIADDQNIKEEAQVHKHISSICSYHIRKPKEVIESSPMSRYGCIIHPPWSYCKGVGIKFNYQEVNDSEQPFSFVFQGSFLSPCSFSSLPVFLSIPFIC